MVQKQIMYEKDLTLEKLAEVLLYNSSLCSIFDKLFGIGQMLGICTHTPVDRHSILNIHCRDKASPTAIHYLLLSPYVVHAHELPVNGKIGFNVIITRSF